MEFYIGRLRVWTVNMSHERLECLAQENGGCQLLGFTPMTTGK